MKRSFVYLALALMLSLLLCACGTDHGTVTASPWPDVTTPILPTPTAEVSATPVPDLNGNNDMTNNDLNNGTGTGNGGTVMGTNSPLPTDTNR